MIVLRDADLDRAANAAAWGGCLMTGQVCMSVERVYVEAPVAEAFTAEAGRARARAARRRERRRRGDRLSVRSPARARSRSSSATSPTRSAKGARVLTGGSARRRRRRHLLRADRARRRRPLDADHARGDLRPGHSGDGGARRRGGAAARERQPLRPERQRVDARRRSAASRSPQRIESGNACVNECVLSAGVPALPFGGVKQSGVGTRHGGAEGLRQFCVRQAHPRRAAPPHDRAGVVPVLDQARARRSSG